MVYSVSDIQQCLKACSTHTNMQNLYKKMDPWIISVNSSGAHNFCRRIKISVKKSMEKGLCSRIPF